MQIKMRGNKVLVAPIKKKESTPEIRFISQISDSNSQGVIEALGSEVKPDLKVGMIIYFTNLLEKIIVEGREMSVMSDDNIICYRIPGDEIT